MGASCSAAQRPGSNDPVLNEVPPWMSRRKRQGAAGRRKTEPAEIETSSDGCRVLTHKMMADLKSSSDGHRALTHKMMADTQRRANVPSNVSDVHIQWDFSRAQL